MIELKEALEDKTRECESLKNVVENERSIYGNTFELLKDKVLNERSKSIDLVSKYTETQIKFNNALQDVVSKEKKYTKLFDKIKQKEQTYEQNLEEINLKLEQEKYINKLFNENPTSQHKSKKCP